MKILLVEDDLVNLTLCEEFLLNLGHAVKPATSAEAAWELSISEYFQVIISDWSLPALSGLDLCKQIRIRKLEEYQYFILITSFQGRDKLTEAMDAGVDDFLVKPIILDDLAIRLRVAKRILEFHGQINRLQKLLPICMYCKNIRNDNEFWQSVETFFTENTGTDFTHSLCPDCYTKHILPQMKSAKPDKH